VKKITKKKKMKKKKKMMMMMKKMMKMMMMKKPKLNQKLIFQLFLSKPLENRRNLKKLMIIKRMII